MFKMNDPILLEFCRVRKQFGPVIALNDVSFSVRAGEVHCLVGENGAGKSTLIKVLAGAYLIDGGELRIDGKPVRIETPAQAAAYGISVVYQDVTNVDKLSIADNIVLGSENSRFGFNQKKKNYEFVRPFLQQVGLEVDPSALMETLSIAQKQMVMIAKALSKNARLIVLDEPTAMLNEQEVHTLFQIICSLRDRGITVVYISHRMEEIYRIGDRVTVLKDGGYVGTWDLSSIDTQQLIVKMVGRELHDVYPDKNRPIGKELLRVENLTTEKIDGVSFTLHEGEVVGLAGLVGSGRTEVLRAIFAADKLYHGKVVLEGNELSLSSSIDAIRHGIGLLPEERKRQGIVNCLSVKDNITMLYQHPAGGAVVPVCRHRCRRVQRAAGRACQCSAHDRNAGHVVHHKGPGVCDQQQLCDCAGASCRFWLGQPLYRAIPAHGGDRRGSFCRVLHSPEPNSAREICLCDWRQ